jgi:quercetin dioxygenase-like cupin family protein
LVRALPGASLPRHRHSQEEEFIVLEGECYIGTHHLRAGDAHFAAAGSWHDDVTTRTGVLVLIRGEYPAPSHP